VATSALSDGTGTLSRAERGNPRAQGLKGQGWSDGDGGVVWRQREVSEREGIAPEESVQGKLNRSEDRLLLPSSVTQPIEEPPSDRPQREQLQTVLGTSNIKEGFSEVSFKVKAYCKLLTD